MFLKMLNVRVFSAAPVSDGPEPVNEHISQKNREEEQKRTGKIHIVRFNEAQSVCD